MLAAALAVVLAQQPYSRTQVERGPTPAECLWWPAGSTITWRQGERGVASVPGDGEFAAVTKAFASWSDVLSRCGSLSLVEGPRTATARSEYSRTSANQNAVYFRTSLCSEVVPASAECWARQDCDDTFDCFAGSLGVAALTYTFADDDGRLLDVDIEVNASVNRDGLGLSFTVDDAPPCPAGTGGPGCVSMDLQGVLTHEVGHLLGLAHSDAGTSLMFPTQRAGTLGNRSVDEGSARFVCEVYAKGRDSGRCLAPATDGTLGRARTGCAADGGAGALGWAVLAMVARRIFRAMLPFKEAP